MIILICGASHTGKTALAQKLLEKNKQERHIRGGLATKRKYKGADAEIT